MRRGGHIPVNKKDGIHALNAGLDALARGDNLGIFPEGSLSNIQDGIQVNRLKTGAVRMAIRAGVPLIPVGFHMPIDQMTIKHLKVGDETVESRFFLRGRYAITVGRPMWLSGDVEDRAHVRGISEELRTRIYDLSQVSALRLRNNVPLKAEKRKKKKKSIVIESGM
jgi:1-acyl-sn-glycerol-3-phosphate acyltransferase